MAEIGFFRKWGMKLGFAQPEVRPAEPVVPVALEVIAPEPAPIGADDISISEQATALHAAITADPGDAGPQLVMADLLLAAEDPRGELIVLHQQELDGGLTEIDALERYLLLAAVYGFPHALPERGMLPWVGESTPNVRYTVSHQLRDFEIVYRGRTIELSVGGRVVLSRRLRGARRLQFPNAWTPEETQVILQAVSDVIHEGTPLHSMRIPYGEESLPSYKGCALRVYPLPSDYTAPRGLSPNQYGLAARDLNRWRDVWYRLGRALAGQRAVAS